MKTKPIKILLVEDTPAHAKIIRGFLDSSKVSQFKLTHAETLEECLNYLERPERFDAILLDLELPDSKELNTLEKVRAVAPQNVAVLIISSKEGEELEAEAVKKGAQDYLVKGSFNSFLLARRIRFALERQRLVVELKEAKENELKQLKSDLENQKALTGWKDTSITAQMAGVGPLQKRAPKIFDDAVKQYKILLDSYLESLGFKQKPPRREINSLADIIGDYGGGPQDVVDIHLLSVVEKTANVHPKRARAYSIEGRLLALEVMGNLVDYYRHARRVS